MKRFRPPFTQTLPVAKVVAGPSRSFGPTVSFRRRRVNRFSRGPPGTTRRYASRTPREMPLYAPPGSARQEMKYIDVASAAYVADTTGAVTFLTPITGGAALNAQREGARVMLCGTQIRGSVLAGSAGVVAKATMVLVYDRQSNKAAPTIAQVYEAANSNSFQVVDYRSRFDVLGRWDFKLIGTSTSVTTDTSFYSIDVKTVFRKLQIWEDTGDGAITDLISGGLFLLTFGDTVAGTGAPNFTLQVRTFYGDN